MPALSPSRSIAIALPQQAVGIGREMDNKLSLKRIAATLQLMLATRRAARSEEHAYWYTVARGM